MTGYQEVNRANWDDRVPVHVASPDYAVERFAAEPDFISDVVRFDLPLLGYVTGLRGVHLHDSVPWDALPGLMEPVTERRMAGSEWRLAADPRRLPHTFTLQVVREE